MEKIILASSSPRRRELLNLIGIPFTVHPSDADETIHGSPQPGQIVEHLALLKAQDVARKYEDGLVIGADTIVVLDGNVLGKPRDEQDAFSMIKKLQGVQHEVYSGVVIINAKTKEFASEHLMTKVYMRKLDDGEITSYIKTKEPLDKAGSYGIQGIGSIFIERIEGDYFNVVGLSLYLLGKLLKRFGIDVLNDIHSKNKA